jgi:hypothetical protein
MFAIAEEFLSARLAYVLHLFDDLVPDAAALHRQLPLAIGPNRQAQLFQHCWLRRFMLSW